MKSLLSAALLCGAFAPSSVLADEAVVLDPIVVTATRSAQPANRLPASVRVITRAEIETSGATHLVDVLRSAGSVQVSDFYGDGSRAQLDLRGFGDAANANTLVLVDGRRLNNPDIATPDLSSISLKDIERIEIIEGSAGALYGDQATGGVINIITRAPQAFAAQAEVFGGSYAALGSRASVQHKSGGTSLRLSGEYRGSDNYRDHNHVEYRNALARGGHDWSGGELWIEGSYIEEDLETPGALFAADVQQNRRQSLANNQGDFSDTDTRILRVGGQQTLGAGWRAEAEVNLRNSHGSAVLGGFALRQNRELRAFNPRLLGTLSYFGRDALITLGADLQQADYELSSGFGQQSNEQNQSDAYVQAILPVLQAVDLSLGLRAAHLRNQVLDGNTFDQPTHFSDDQIATQFGLAWQLTAGLRLFARYDGNYRYAKVDEFTFTSASPGSNQNVLKTQEGDSFETGAEWAGERLSLRAALYRLNNDNEIAFDPNGTGPFGPFGANINLPKTRRDGVLARARWQVTEQLSLALGGHYVDGEITAGSLQGKRIPLSAAKIGSLSATLRLPWQLSLFAETQYTGARAFAGDFDNSLGELPSHAVSHLALGWDWRALSLSLRAGNLFNREYSEYGAAGFDASFSEAQTFYPSPERNFSLSARWDF